MNRLYYHHSFFGIWMIVISGLQVDDYSVLNDVVILRSKGSICGFNILNMPELSSGYHQLNNDKLQLINEKLLENNLVELSEQENPLYVAEIVEIVAIEDKGFVCKVNLGAESRQIVTKAKNVRLGQKVVVALPSAVLYNGIIIEESVIYGEISSGVFGSKQSLFGLNEDLGLILELSEEYKVGDKFNGKCME